MSNTKVFSRVAGLHPGMSVFDLSYTKLLTCDMGQLIPVMCDEVVPGDVAAAIGGIDVIVSPSDGEGEPDYTKKIKLIDKKGKVS